MYSLKLQLTFLSTSHNHDFYLAFDLQGEIQMKGRGTGERPEITPARVPKGYQTKGILPEQLTQP